MKNTATARATLARGRIGAPALALALSMGATWAQPTDTNETSPMHAASPIPSRESAALTQRQRAIVPIAAFASAGDIGSLNKALDDGLNAGLTVNEAKEILVQLYAYAGFPRSLNALAALMKVLEARKARGIHDAAGSLPSQAAPTGEALLQAGTANQTRLAGSPVRGPLFEFAPAIDTYLKTHLFGDIFERDNLDWQSRELATIGMLSALPGVEAQLQAHMRIGMNVGLGSRQLRELTQLLAERVGTDAASRARGALEAQIGGQP